MLAVANALCSSLAVNASTKIRRGEFPGLELYIRSETIYIFRNPDKHIVATISFESENDLIGFVAAAFPNCIFEDLFISSSVNKQILDAIGRVADSVVVPGVLLVACRISHDDSLGFVRKFRKVKVSFTLFALSCIASVMF